MPCTAVCLTPREQELDPFGWSGEPGSSRSTGSLRPTLENELEPHLSDDDREDAVATAPAAPGVVAALVVHSPTEALGECLDSLKAQDYPNLQTLVLVTGSAPEDVALVNGLVEARSMAAHVRHVGSNPGFAAVANSVARLVQGDSGFFLFLHDDVALDPDAVRLMVEELYRSNAGLVGPKIVEWDDVRRLQMVGFDADRFGELDSAIEEHEIDQEQHDAVRDVFVLPSACLLVRADLFREMGGFEESIEFHGEDLDLCWRAHLMGARVVVAPAARVRHRGGLRDRRPDLSHVAMDARHRLSTVASLTGAARSFVVVPALIVVTLIEAIVSLVTGHVRRASTEVGALLMAPRDTVSILRRRRRVAALRRIPDREIADLQVRGSVRWRRVVRGRQRSAGPAADRGTSDDAGSREPVAVAAWFVLWALLLVGARDLIAGGVASIADMMPWADSPRDLVRSYLSGWWDKDLGATTAQPTGNLLMALAGVLTLGHPALAQTMAIIGLVAAGWLGASRLCAVASVPRARLIGTIAYAAVPLPYAAVAAGRLQALIAYAVLPWALHLMRLFGGLGLPRGAEESSRAVGDVVDHPDTATRVRVVSAFALLMSVTAAFAPSVMLVVLVCALLWILATVLAGGSSRAAGLGIAAVLVSIVAAVVVNLPWMTRYLASDGWRAFIGSRTGSDLGVWQLLRFGIGPSALGGLVILLFVPALVAPFVSRGWRFVWAMRAAVLIAGSMLLAVLGQRTSFPVDLPEPGVLLAPAAVGVALGVSMVWVVFGADVRGARFGLRQPVALVSLACIPLGLVPALAVASDGRWQQPDTTFSEQMTELLATDDLGGFRVLIIGDERLIPGASHEIGAGLGYSVVESGRLDADDLWTPAPDDVDRYLEPLIEAVASGATDRVGRLMAPLGVRYVVIPVVDRVISTTRDPLPVPDGLVESFGAQLDFRRKFSPASMIVFENQQVIPTVSILTAAGSDAASSGGDEALAVVDMSGATPVSTLASPWSTVSETVPAGTLHLGVPLDGNWSVAVDGRAIDVGASFGSVMSATIVEPGVLALSHDRPLSRVLWVLAQLMLWSILVVGWRQPRNLRRRASSRTAVAVDDSPIIAMEDRP